ncbi:ABC transporter permease [Balneatrix alpica]|uniref:ABC transporter permease n=1 Tax=Balneatrix alpica TaxID=75684 RepID=A0ABV5ZD26_9GAMM|nr:ABC transporter permease [Balneatrix alpica]
MAVFIVRRLLQSLVVLWLVSMIVFFGIYAIGDPIELMIHPESTQAEIEAAIRNLGLDQPIWQQYLTFVSNALQGDLGTSFVYNRPTLELVIERMPASFELALVALLLALLIGMPLGMLAGLYPDTWLDRSLMTGSILGFSIPNFWQGLMLIMVFSVILGVLPPNGRGETGTLLGIETSLVTWDGLRHLLLPALNLALFKIAIVMRMTRSGLREVMLSDYIKFARAKGLTPRRIVLVHAMKNTMIPLITIIGMEFGSLIAYGVVTETIFAWPGMGKLTIDSINNLDRPVVVGYLMLVVFMFITINLIVDILYSLFDPRIRLGGSQQ